MSDLPGMIEPIADIATDVSGTSRPSRRISSRYSGSEYSFDDESIITKDTMEDFLERFTLDFRPEYTLKLRTRAGPFIFGADAAAIHGTTETFKALVVKPVDHNQWWRRIRLDDTGMVTVRSRKLQWWLFTLSLEGHANPWKRTTDFSFRVATKWNFAKGEYSNKKRIQLGDASELRTHWSISYDLPEIAGTFGAGGGGNRNISQDMHADIGYAHAEVSKMELVLWPLKNKPQRTVVQYLDEVEDDLHKAVDKAAIASPSPPTTNGGPKDVEKAPAVAAAVANVEASVVSDIKAFFKDLPSKIDNWQGTK